MPYDIGPKIGVDGEAEFRKQIQQITENIKTLGSELKVVASAADAEGESIQSLSQKNEILNKTVSQLEDRLTAQRDMLDKATEKYGEADSRTQKWQRTVNATITELNKLQAQISQNNAAINEFQNALDNSAETELQNELQKISDNIKTFGSELKVVTSAANLNGESLETLAGKNQILNKTIDELEKKLSAQKNMLKLATDQYGDASTETQKWQRAVNDTETELNNLRAQINKNNTAMDKLQSATDDADNALDDLGDSADNASGKLSAMAVAMGNLIASGIEAAISAVGNLVSSIWNLDESTEEFRQAQGRLNTAFESAGYSAETAQQAYDGFYSVLGDTDRATEASQLLAQLAEEEQDVAKWTEIAAGVNGTFGDSLPIEGLIEAA